MRGRTIRGPARVLDLLALGLRLLTSKDCVSAELCRTGAPDTHAMVATEHRLQPYQILVSDDDKTCRETVRDVLASQGYRTHLASCGREAIQVARRQFLHVVIVDMNMPDLSGLETVTIIRREVSVAVPSILMSADPSRELMRQALSAHFDSFMPKPLDVGSLRHVVEEIIRRHYEGEL